MRVRWRARNAVGVPRVKNIKLVDSAHHTVCKIDAFGALQQA